VPDLSVKIEKDQSRYEPRWDWNSIERILLIRLRSIGDAVLTTPSITALRRFLPDVQIDILLEDWVAPVLRGFDAADNIITFSPGTLARLKTARRLRQNRYDVIYNLHGGTTSTFLTYAAGARHKVGFGHYRYSFLYDHLSIPALDFWQSADLHSAEQQLALLGWTGVPVSDRPRTSLTVQPGAAAAISEKLAGRGVLESERLALFHPAAAFASKQWAAGKFAQAARYLHEKGFTTVAVAAASEEPVLREVREASLLPVHTFADLTLPEITALAARAKIFVGNDSGIAHIAAAVDTPCVVIFGSSNVIHWRPYTGAPNDVVVSDEGIEKISVEMVTEAIEKILRRG
jgi:lipopolysaccharide heptosyltransferase II